MKKSFVDAEEHGPLSLTNDGQLELVFIGVGSAFATTNHNSNFLLIKGEDHVLVDFGFNAQAALARNTGLVPTDIQVLLPTHSHADHIGGFECMALMNRYVGRPAFKKEEDWDPKLKMVINEHYQQILWTHSLQGGLEWNEDGPHKGQRLHFCDFFDIIRPTWRQASPRETWEVNVGGIHIEMFRTKHIPDTAVGWEDSFVSYGMFVDGHLFISGDTRFDRDLIDLYADRSSVMFHDVQFFPGAVHAFLDDLKTLPADVTRKMHLYHYADNWKDQDIAQFAGWALPGVRYRVDE